MRRAFPVRGCLFALLVPLLAACAGTTGKRPLPVPEGSPAAHLISGLPYHPQIEDQCGPASLATVLGYWGTQVDPESLRGVLYIPDKGGTVTTEMTARARRFGFLAYEMAPGLDALVTEVAAGNPVLVLQNLSFDWLPMWHYSIVTGYDAGQQLLLLRSGHERVQEVPVSLFLKTWERAGRWGLVIVPPARIPASANDAAFLAAASELEVTGNSAAALQAYQAAIARWPQATAALFGAGNAAYQRGDYLAASGYFGQFIVARPDSGAGWNNLAYALRERGCEQAAREALRCAVALEPGNPDYARSLGDFTSDASPGNATCELPACAAP